MKKLRVGVLMGGKSLEKEVSFNSGRTICDHLDTARYHVIPLYQNNTHLYILPWKFLHRGKTIDFEHRLQHEAEKIAWDDLKKQIDFVYIAQHGRYAEDGILQGFLEVLDIPYLGSGIFASAVRMDKITQKTFLSHANIQTPKFIAVEPHEIENFAQHKTTIKQKLDNTDITTCIVKPYNEGSSIGISVVSDFNDLETALKHACYIEAGVKKRVIIEEKINGMEFSCIILVDYKTDKYLPLPPTEVIPEKGASFFDYEQKYMPGRSTKFTPARCTAENIKKIQETCIAVMKALEFTTMARIDGFLTQDGHVIIIDPNTLSGMGPSSFIFNQAAEVGMSHSKLINHLIETELQHYGMLENIIKQEKKEAEKMHNKKIRVAVLLGGRSHEKEISLESGRNVFYKLSPHKYDAFPVFVNKDMELFKITPQQLVRNSTKEIESLLTESQKIKWNNLPELVDFVFIGLHGGEGENGAVQGTLEMLGMPYNGSSVLTSALCMDKYKTTQFLKQHGFEVPNNFLVSQHEWKNDREQARKKIEKKISYPVIVKPHDDGCSVMVQKAHNKNELTQYIENVFAQEKNNVLIEEFITGMELTVGVIGNEKVQALIPSQAVAQKDILSIEEKFLPGAGENQTPAPLPKDALQLVQKTMEKAYKTLQCKGYARIDCFFVNKKTSSADSHVIILEVNTLPGMTPATCIFHQAAEIGLKPMDFIDTIIELGFEEHKKNISLPAHTKISTVEKAKQ